MIDDDVDVVNKDELQNKSKRYYFKKLKSLQPDIIWLSYFDPNIENEVVEIPLNPTIRMGTKLKNSEILIINLSLKKIFEKIQTSSFLSDGKSFFIKTNSGIWEINNSFINYEKIHSSDNFFIEGFIKSVNNPKFNRTIFIETVIDAFDIIILITLLITCTSLLIDDYLQKHKLLAYEDSLTKCYNRNFFETKLYNLKDLNLYAICYVDIDRLKLINDTYGHKYGDVLITSVTKKLKSSFSDEDIIIRIGGDEFIILSKKCINNIEKLMEKIELDLLKKDVCGLPISFSYGISLSENFDKTLSDSESKMYKMKNNKKASYK